MTKSTHHLGSPEETSMREYIITLKDKNDSDGGMNVNVRLGMYNTPDVDFTVTS